MPRRRPAFTPPSALRISSLSLADELGFDVLVKRSPRRRTLELIIRSGDVILMLPAFVSDREARQFVRDRRDWVLATLDKQQQLLAESAPRRYQEGELFPFLGRDHALKIFIARGRASVQLANGNLYAGIKPSSAADRPEQLKKIIRRWYQKQAREMLTQKTLALAASIGREVQSVKLRRTKTKWGHCTADGVIQYNWQIVAAPEPVVDYLVAHEVSHLVHRNHGQRFWKHVARLYPDYLPHQQWLKDNGHKLSNL